MLKDDFCKMDEGALRSFLESIIDNADKLMQDIDKTPGLSNDKIVRYAEIKNILKNVYHYTGLGRNSTGMTDYYEKYFSPAIREAYVHCKAPTNSRNRSEVFGSLYDVVDYIEDSMK